jgi:glycolate oxidase
VAENAGGVHCLKYGLTVNNVLGARVVLADGSIVELGGALYDNPGPDLLALLCGSEGMLGIVTQVTVALLPTPETKAVLLAGFSKVVDAGNAGSRDHRRGHHSCGHGDDGQAGSAGG